jgi:hypothetical protein
MGYRFDAQYRLYLKRKSGVPGEAFTFDEAGNRTVVRTGAAILPATYATYTADDQMLS